MKYFDAHNHIQNYASDSEEAAALAAAADAGVQGMICCGTCQEDWGNVLELAGRYEGVVPAFGLHPWRDAEDGWPGRLEEFLRRVPAACVGEIGLDGIKGLPGQEKNFAVQLELAARFNRPAVIHCVKSWGRMLEMLGAAALPAFMLHAYSGPAEMVKAFADLNGYFSFGGEIQDPERDKLRAALAAVPADRLLFETESPEPGGPLWRSGPAGVAQVVAAAAGLLDRPVGELSGLLLANSKRFTGVSSND
jgi:TatD DNase family protein